MKAQIIATRQIIDVQQFARTLDGSRTWYRDTQGTVYKDSELRLIEYYGG